MENNYISQYLGKIYEISKTASPEEILPMVQELEELLKKKIESDKTWSDPNRLQPFGTPEPETKPKDYNPEDLQPFGTPEEPKGFGM